jgi:hypothetical protein
MAAIVAANKTTRAKNLTMVPISKNPRAPLELSVHECGIEKACGGDTITVISLCLMSFCIDSRLPERERHIRPSSFLAFRTMFESIDGIRNFKSADFQPSVWVPIIGVALYGIL